MFISLGTEMKIGVLSPRLELDIVLQEGSTVADYRADVGVPDALTVASWANQIGIAGPLLQGTGSAEPNNLRFEGVKHSWHPGVNSNNITTPDVAAYRPVGDLELYLTINPVTYSTAGTEGIAIDGNTSAPTGRNWYIYLSAGGFLNLSRSDAAGNRIYTVDVSAYSVIKYFKLSYIQNDSGVSRVNFYAGDSYDAMSLIGTDTNASVLDGVAETNGVFIGTNHAGTTPFSGKIYHLKVVSGIGGTTVLDYNPNRDAVENIVNGYTFASSTTSETYTLNNTGGMPAQIVGSASVMGDGVATFMQAAFALPTPYTIHLVFCANTWVSDNVIIDGVDADYEFSLQQFTGTPQVRITDSGASTATVAPVLQTWNIITMKQNAAGDWSLQLNNGTAVTGTGSATALTGLTLFRKGLTAGGFAAVQMKEIIGRSVYDSAASITTINNLLKSIYGTP